MEALSSIIPVLADLEVEPSLAQLTSAVVSHSPDTADAMTTHSVSSSSYWGRMWALTSSPSEVHIIRFPPWWWLHAVVPPLPIPRHSASSSSTPGSSGSLATPGRLGGPLENCMYSPPCAGWGSPQCHPAGSSFVCRVCCLVGCDISLKGLESPLAVLWKLKQTAHILHLRSS